MKNELKPCPFCGSKVRSELYQEHRFIECPRCEQGVFGEADCITAESLVDLWNARPIEDALQTRIAELEAIVNCAAKWLYHCTCSCPSDICEWEHPLECMSHCETLKQPDDWWKCWALFLMENQDPPKEAK